MSEDSEKTGEKVDTKFKSGDKWTGNKEGRPKGSISIKDEIRRRLRDNPEQFDDLVKYYMTNEQAVMKKLLWEMLEGKPKEQVEATVSSNIELSDEQLERIIKRRADELNGRESS